MRNTGPEPRLLVSVLSEGLQPQPHRTGMAGSRNHGIGSRIGVASSVPRYEILLFVSPSFARGQNCSYNRAYTYKLSSVIPQASVLVELDPQRLSTPHSLAIHIDQPVRCVIPFLVHTTCAMPLAARIYPSLSKPNKLYVAARDSDSGSVLMSIVPPAFYNVPGHLNRQKTKLFCTSTSVTCEW